MSEDAPCGKCGKSVTYEDNGVGCEGACGQWYHITCIDMDFDFYLTLVCNERALWKCDDCMTRNFVKTRNANGSNCSSHSSCSDSDSSDDEQDERKLELLVIKEEQDLSPVPSPAVYSERENPMSDLLLAVKKEREFLSEIEEANERKERHITKDLVPKLKKDPDESLNLLKECNIKKEIEEITIEEHTQFRDDADVDLNDVLSCLQSGNLANNKTRLLVQDCDNVLPLPQEQDEVHLETEASTDTRLLAQDCDNVLPLPQQQDGVHREAEASTGELPLEKSDVFHLDLSLKLPSNEIVERSRCRTVTNYRKINKSGKSHMCNMCNLYFRKTYHLERHHLCVHLGLKRFTCSVCPNAFNSKYILAKHMLSEHDNVPTLLDVARLLSDVQEYQCSYCGKYLDCKSALIYHIRSHTGEKPFACHLCSKCYTYRSNLNIHLARHGIHVVKSKRILNSSLSQFECDICKKEFHSKGRLRQHLKRECFLKCKGCSKLFDNHIEFRRHVQMCVREWPFPCSICDRGFSRRKSLLRHLHVHDPNFYYDCEFCKRRFKRKGTLATHLQFKCTPDWTH